MRVSVIQMSPQADKYENITQARALMEGALASDKPDLIALPEIWTCLGGDRGAKLAAAESLPSHGGGGEEAGQAYEFLRNFALTHQVHVHGGSIGEFAGDRLFNTTLVFSPDGREIARYRKLHLFDITTLDGQGYRESDTYGAGEDVVTCEVGGFKIGLAICYDLRFPELFLALRRQHVDLIMLPAAFTLQTGKDHWEVLLRARAIETQTWFAAPAAYGAYQEASGETRQTYGHSMIVNPWGQVISQASDGVGWTTGTIDKTFMARVRANMPVLEHRRLV
jgi:nitrilase